MKTVRFLLIVMCAAGLTGCMTAKGGTVTERQATVQQINKDTLEELSEKQPETDSKMEQAVGYGVFKKMGAAFFVAGTSNGFGLITNKETGEETYMRAFTGSAGLGFGVKNFRVVIIFYWPTWQAERLRGVRSWVKRAASGPVIST